MQIEQTPAERFYENHKKHVAKYQRLHPQNNNEKCKRYMTKLKNECPEKYEIILQKKRDYYRDVIKPREAERKRQLVFSENVFSEN
jgi:hypothetical protein